MAARIETLALAAGVVLALSGLAHADILPRRTRSDCRAATVARPGEDCVDCSTSWSDQDACALRYLPEGRQRRCIGRVTRIEEVWCKPRTDEAGATAPKPVASGAAPSHGDPSPAPRGGGCALVPDGASASNAGPVLALLCLLLALARRRSRRLLVASALGLVACRRPSPRPDAAQARASAERELQRIQDDYRERTDGRLVAIPDWKATADVTFGAFHLHLPAGWGEDAPPQHDFAWFTPKADRSRYVEIRIHARNPLVAMDAVKFRRLLAHQGKLGRADLGDLAQRLPSDLVVSEVSVRRWTRFNALVIRGTLPKAGLERTSVFVDAEAAPSQDASIDVLHVSVPVALEARYRADLERVLDTLELHSEARGNLQAEASCCDDPRPAAMHDCENRMLWDGYDERPFRDGCLRFVLPADPEKRSANIAALRKKQALRDPICTPGLCGDPVPERW